MLACRKIGAAVTHVVGQSGQRDAVGFQQDIPRLEHPGGPRCLVGKQSFDAYQPWEWGGRVRPSRHGQTQATGPLRHLDQEDGICGKRRTEKRWKNLISVNCTERLRRPKVEGLHFNFN